MNGAKLDVKDEKENKTPKEIAEHYNSHKCLAYISDFEKGMLWKRSLNKFFITQEVFQEKIMFFLISVRFSTFLNNLSIPKPIQEMIISLFFEPVVIQPTKYLIWKEHFEKTTLQTK